jgi:hypothetical protein
MSATPDRTQSAGPVVVDGGMSAMALSRRVFAGELLVLRGLPSMQALVAAARTILEDAFAPQPPPDAEQHFVPKAYRAACLTARRRFRDSPDVRRLFREVLAAAGLPPAETYADRLVLRTVPVDPALRGGRVRTLPPHRDTWGSNLPQQVNWWAPVYPLTAGNTLVVYPGSFARPVGNDSAGWDFAALQRRRAAGGSYRQLPVATETPDPADARPVLIAPGEMLAYSGAHLHASATPPTGGTRFNLETRTIWAGDLAAGRGAPDVDGAAPRIGWGWFRHLDSGAPLAPQDGA